MKLNDRTEYKFKVWRPFFDVGLCYISFGVCVWVGLHWPMALPICLLIIANRLLALSLICHEGLHGLLFKNKKLNNFFGRWLCAFPTCISFSKYKKLHLIHHTTVGNEKFDPDIHLYNFFPIRTSRYLLRQLVDLVTLKTTRQFILYYTEIFDFYIIPSGDRWAKIKQKIAAGDFIAFCAFHLTIIIATIVFDFYKEYLLFFAAPLIFITQPYVLLMAGLQHGPLPEENAPELISRTIRGPKLLMEILLPLDINYHSEHHFNSTIPHYWLKKYSLDLQQQGKKTWTTDYISAVDALLVRK